MFILKTPKDGLVTAVLVYHFFFVHFDYVNALVYFYSFLESVWENWFCENRMHFAIMGLLTLLYLVHESFHCIRLKLERTHMLISFCHL